MLTSLNTEVRQLILCARMFIMRVRICVILEKFIHELHSSPFIITGVGRAQAQTKKLGRTSPSEQESRENYNHA